MNEVSPEQILESMLFEPQFIDRWINKTDNYGENRIEKFFRKLESIQKFAMYFEFDEFVAKSIILGCEIVTPVFGEIGEEFLKSKILKYSKSEHGRVLMENFLKETNYSKKDAIVNGVFHVLDGTLIKSEDVIVNIVNYAQENADKIKSGIEQNIAYYTFIQNTIKESVNNGKLLALKFPEIPKELYREKKFLDKEKKKLKLNEMYSFYLKHIECIPVSFRIGLELPEREIVAYYVASQNDFVVKNFDEKLE